MTRQSQSPAETLLEMLAYRRPAGSDAEINFIAKYLLPLGVRADGAGNMIKQIGNSPTLWSCHTDTVHRKQGRQRLLLKRARYRR